MGRLAISKNKWVKCSICILGVILVSSGAGFWCDARLSFLEDQNDVENIYLHLSGFFRRMCIFGVWGVFFEHIFVILKRDCRISIRSKMGEFCVKKSCKNGNYRFYCFEKSVINVIFIWTW